MPKRRRDKPRKHPISPNIKRPTPTVHPNTHELYTPLTPEVAALLERMKNELGTWRDVSAATLNPNDEDDYIHLRTIRRIRYGMYPAVSERILDRLITATGVGNLSDYPWFTPEDLIKLGLWKDILSPEERAAVPFKDVPGDNP